MCCRKSIVDDSVLCVWFNIYRQLSAGHQLGPQICDVPSIYQVICNDIVCEKLDSGKNFTWHIQLQTVFTTEKSHALFTWIIQKATDYLWTLYIDYKIISSLINMLLFEWRPINITTQMPNSGLESRKRKWNLINFRMFHPTQTNVVTGATLLNSALDKKEKNSSHNFSKCIHICCACKYATLYQRAGVINRDKNKLWCDKSDAASLGARFLSS